MTDDGCIGIFDSGVGGLSVWREIVRELPWERTVYVADQAHVPYGSRSLSEVCTFAEGITRFLLGHRTKLIVIASNTTSAAALYALRTLFPHVPFVGMEPAIKPAAERTRTGAIGVMATRATFQGEPFFKLKKRFTNEVWVLSQACPGLVDAVEAGALDTTETAALVERYVSPMIEAQVDQLVLGCTHYPFLRSVIEQIAGPGISVIDPAPSIARQVAHLLRQGQPGTAPRTAPREGRDRASRHVFYTTGNVAAFDDMLRRLVSPTGKGPGNVRAAAWLANRLEAMG